MIIAAFAGALLLTAVHLFAGKLRVLRTVPRSAWLSAASGVSVAYVFLHLLPELSAGEEALRRALGPAVGAEEEHVFLISLAGLAAFYGLERMARKSHARGRDSAAEGQGSRGVFWIHISSFALYNALIGYLLLHLEERSLAKLALFTVAIGLHFLVNDHDLEEHHRELYERRGRWILSVAVLGGWGAGALTSISDAAVTAILAVLAGGIILNVLKEELPEEQKSRYWAFLLGIAGYSALLLAL